MNPTVFQLECGGKFKTVKTCGGAVGAARGMFGKGKTSWQQISEKIMIVTINDLTITVTEISISLAIV